MAETNRDGLPLGQPVDFETMQRINRKHREEARNARAQKRTVTAGRRRGKKALDDSPVATPEETEE